MAAAYMRVLGAGRIPLDLVEVENDDVWVVGVPLFGFLVVTKQADHPNAAHAMLSQDRGSERWLDVTRPDGRIECEILGKADRLCVVIEP